MTIQLERSTRRGDLQADLTADLTALVDFWGVRRRVRLDLVDDEVAPGDYVLNHVGFAIRRIPAEDVQTTLELYEHLLTESSRDDLMTADVRSEIEAGCTVSTSGRASQSGERGRP